MNDPPPRNDRNRAPASGANDVGEAFTIRANSLELSCRPRYILAVHTTRRGCPETLFFLHFSRSLGPWQRIPPSPPPIFGSEKVLQNQAFPEPPDFGGGAPRWSTAASPSCHLSVRLASQKGSLAAPLSQRFPPARAMGQECATPKVLTRDGRATFPEFPPF